MEPTVGPVIDTSKVLSLQLPPVAIVLLGIAGYTLLLACISLLRYFLRSKGSCQTDLCDCQGIECCQCIENCADACTCSTPTVAKCLDTCCLKRNLDCVGLILCQCCASNKDNMSCCGTEGPCCTYGDLNCNCACIQPDLDSVNCLCCQFGTNYNRANGDD